MNNSVAIIGTRGYPSYYGGFETLVRELAPFLTNHGWDVTVYGRKGAIRSDDPAMDPRVRRVTTLGIETKSLSTLSYGLTSSAHAAIRRHDVALVMNVANGFWLPVLRASGIPTVVNVDGIEWEREKWGRKAKAAFRLGAKLTARFATDLVFDSREIERRWSHEFNRTGEYIPYGANEPEQLEPTEGLAPGAYALAVARFVPENTIEEFFQSAEQLSQKWDVVIVGSSGYGGPLDEKARAISDSNPRIHWLGHISDDTKLFSIWQNAGVYFHGHSVGGTNPALVQAMACGVPIVARDTPYNREVLQDAGILVAPTADAITKELDRVLSNREFQSQLGISARRRQQENYTWHQVCSDYETALRNAIRPNSPEAVNSRVP
ncbi:glycosyltransferase [Rhodococcus ruber]|uniref:glycosyltransferase n=1 Tax=Rhodococcus ruber TaxID=1830 RepID=UPI0009EC569F|nr:glycosyltransferase [Rhodococcus ruber]